jgi:hypothetical protein
VEIVICGYKSTTHAIPFLSSNRSRSYFWFPPGRRPARSTPSPTSSNVRGPLPAHARKSTWTEIATTGIIWRVNSARLRRRKSSLSRQLDLNSRSLKVYNKYKFLNWFVCIPDEIIAGSITGAQGSFGIKSRNRKNAWRTLKCGSASGHCLWVKSNYFPATTAGLTFFTWQSSGPENCRPDDPMATPDPIRLSDVFCFPAGKSKTNAGRAIWAWLAIRNGTKLWFHSIQTV